MTIRWLLASLHLLALGIGLGAVFCRAYELKRIHVEGAVRRALLADGFWGLAALLWISTGLLRAFGGFEKGTGYYLSSTYFLTKMGLLLLILVLEIQPIVRLTTWRLQLRDGTVPDLSRARLMAYVSYLQAVIVVTMLGLATAMARGFGM